MEIDCITLTAELQQTAQAHIICKRGTSNTPQKLLLALIIIIEAFCSLQWICNQISCVFVRDFIGEMNTIIYMGNLIEFIYEHQQSTLIVKFNKNRHA